jgi:hypothetical protein
MKVRHQRGLSCPLSTAAALLSLGCGAEAALDEAELDRIQSAMAGGTVITGALGVVEFTLEQPQPVSCTGTMIAPNVVLTAAHCFVIGLGWARNADGASLTEREGSILTTVYYYDPDVGRRNVFSGDATWIARESWDLAPGGGGDFGSTLGDFPGDANDDIGLLIIPGTFTNTDYRDYKRIYDDIASPLDDTFLGAYGAGIFDDFGTWDHELRKGSFEVENVSPEHIITDNEAQRTCGGDSGGPLVKLMSPSGAPKVELVAGINSMREANQASPGSDCANDSPQFPTTGGDNTAWCRAQMHMAWIENAGGLSCTRLHATAGFFYRRCFSLSFINEVSYESLISRETTVALAASTILL